MFEALADLPEMYVTTLLDFMTHPALDVDFMMRNWDAQGCYYHTIEECLGGQSPEDSRWNTPVSVLWSGDRKFAYVTTTSVIADKVGITFVHKSLVFGK